MRKILSMLAILCLFIAGAVALANSTSNEVTQTNDIEDTFWKDISDVPILP